jgi:adenylate cyclase
MNVRDFFLHRVGATRLSSDVRLEVVGKAFESSGRGRKLVDTFGNRELRAFVGFIDLVGFSAATSSMSPQETRDFIRQFLDPILRSLEESNCYIDKTIGDEVLFILPDMEAEEGVHVNLRIGRTMGGLDDVLSRFSGSHAVRLGLAFGTVILDSVGSGDYCEWTTMGAPVTLAKRLHSLDELESPEKFAGAFSMLDSDVNSKTEFPVRSAHVTLSGMRWNIRRSNFTQEFKGVGLSRVVTFEKRPAPPPDRLTT